jgi:type VI secretion system protein ImpK
MAINAEALRTEHARDDAETLQMLENLPLLYQGLITVIVRVKARRQHITDGDAFRKRTRAMLQEVERFASAAGYEARDVRDTHFAVVAFLDSVILNMKEPVRAEWERKTLQEEMFGQTDAGVVFFEKLEHFRTRPDSPRTADILEVYLLCLLLGFEGRYSGASHADLDVIVEKVRRRIDDIRGLSQALSPEGAPAAAAEFPGLSPRRADRLMYAAIGAIVFSLLLFLVLWSNLATYADDLRLTLR